MNSVALPPSPNWYLSSILAVSRKKTVAWGAKNYIVIAKQKDDDLTLKYSIIPDAHVDKVTALAFNSTLSNGCEMIISCGDDDKAKIWNTDKLELVIVISFGDDKPIVGVDWSLKDNSLVCAVNSHGYLMSCSICHFRRQNAKKMSLGKLTATCLACCPHEASLVAVGSKCGLIYIVDLDKNGSILYKLRGHDEEVVSLSWCPSDMNVLSADSTRDLLLASGAKDKSVFIWKAGTDGRCECIINLPKLPIASQSHTSQPHKSKLGTTNGAWTTVCWAEPKVLLTSSLWGELLLWDLSVNKGKKAKQYELLHTHHNRGLFCIAIKPRYYEIPENWRKSSKLIIWTLAQDRWVICCSKQESKPIELKYKIPTQGGYVYCIAPCPIDTSRIAFGTGDMMLRLWNLSDPRVTNFDVTMFWQKIKGKLRVISWQPGSERLLAFGTSEGRVGIIDVLKNVPILFRQYHRKVIYKLEWGRVPNRDDLGLFSCSEGELVIYDVNDPINEPMSIINEECTEFSWKPDNLILAIALENGRILFYDQNFKKCGDIIYLSKKTVNCLAWHPESTAVDTWSSPMKDYLAVASDKPHILIYDISNLRKELERGAASASVEDVASAEEVTDAVEDGQNQQRNTHKLRATLKGHCDKVVCLAWSPHITGYLVSGSYDYSAQVWNVEKQELMGTYTGHNGPVLSCMWSSLNPQLIITGSSDFMISIWDYTLPEQSPKSLLEEKKKKLKQKAQKCKMSNVKMITLEEHNEPITSNSSPTDSTISTIVEVVEPKSQLELIKDIGKKKDKRPSYFSVHNKIMNDKCAILNCIKNDIKNQEQNSELENGENDRNVATLSLFSEKEDLQIIIAKEKLALTQIKHRNETVTEMEIWCDRLRENIECAIKENRLNDFLVSLSTSLSVNTWKETCEAYANQLIREGNVEKAVSYLLCIHKNHEAVKAFADVRMFKEAYVLARLKLADNDPTLAVVLQSWAYYATTTGQLEQAAHCYVKLGEFAKAAKLLSRRKSPEPLEIAYQLAFMSGDVEFSMSLAEDAVVYALMKLKYSQAHSIIKNIQELQHLEVYIDAYELITSTYKKENAYDLMLKWVRGKSDDGMLQNLKKKHNVSHYNALQRNNVFFNRVTMDNCETEQHLNVSYHVALAVTSEAKETQLKHIVAALDHVLQYKMGKINKYMDLFIHLLIMLDLKKPTDEDSIYVQSDYPVSKSIRAYLCVGLSYWITIYIEHLSIDEEDLFLELIVALMEDTCGEEIRKHVDRIYYIEQLEPKVKDFLLNKANGTSGTTEENESYESYENMKLEEKNFIEERVSVPDINTVIGLVNELYPRWNKYRRRLQQMNFQYDEFARNVCMKTEIEKTEEEEIKLHKTIT